MSNREAIITSLVCLTVITLGVIIAYTSITKYRAEVEINAQTEIEKTRIQEHERSQRADTHLDWFPWN
jgi:hypothetical protein